jgi:hypothetical protein
MGFLSGLANATGLQVANIEANPEQAAVGANTPETTYAMNKTVAPTTGKQYTPTVNMYGGYTQGEMQQNAAQGYSNTGPAAVNAIGQATAAYLTGGSSAAGQAALDQYTRNNPNSNLTQQVNYAANPSVNGGIDAEPNVSVNRGINYGYNKGGSVKGLSDLAHHLKAHGRGEDTELVHMTKGEVQALKGIAHAAGGKLTTNPETGLTEAGFLSSMLPMVAGIALDVLSDGALTPLTTGLIVGAGDYAMTGSLKQGLLAGIGAYGGAGISDSLAELGANTAADAGTDAIGQIAGPGGAGTTADQEAINEIIKNQASQGANALQGLQQAGSSLSNAGSFLADNYGKVAAATAPILSDALTQRPTLSGLAPTGQGSSTLKYLSSDFKGQFPAQPNPAYEAKYPNYVQNPYQPAGIAQAAQGGAVEHFANKGSVKSEYDPSVYDPLTYMGNDSIYSPQHYMPKAKEMAPVAGDTSTYTDTDPDTRNMSAYDTALTRLSKLGATPSAGLTPTIKARKMGTLNTAPAMVQAQQAAAQQAPTQLPEVETAAAGGMMGDPTDFAAGGMYPGSQIDKTQYASSPQMPASMQTTMAGYDPQTNPLTGEPTLHMASGGVSYGLGGYSDGGRLLRGPGDGMSDNIPAVIGKKQPARLADGEFVVPADVVSHLGNGSTEAGAKHLYAMMDKIRRARTGKTKQAPAVKADKYIPK